MYLIYVTNYFYYKTYDINSYTVYIDVYCKSQFSYISNTFSILKSTNNDNPYYLYNLNYIKYIFPSFIYKNPALSF